MGMVYSAPPAPINVALTVGAEFMGIWVPDSDAQAYAARRVLQSVIAATYGLLWAGLLDARSRTITREKIWSDWKVFGSRNPVCWSHDVQRAVVTLRVVQ
jgi:hypothetical protein